MDRRCGLIIGGVILVALIIRYYEDMNLWHAAGKHYSGFAKEHRSLLIDACEVESRKHRLFSEDSPRYEWSKEAKLVRGRRGLDPEWFPWETQYEFALHFYYHETVAGKPFQNVAYCRVAPRFWARNGVGAEFITIDLRD